MKYHSIVALISIMLIACGGSGSGGNGGGGSTPPPSTIDLNVRAYNFIYQGSINSDVTISGKYEQLASGVVSKVLHDNATYASIVGGTLVQALKNDSGDVDVTFELRDGNSTNLLASQIEKISSDAPTQLVFAVGDTTQSSPEYELEVINSPTTKATATTAPLYIINLLGSNSVNVYIDDTLFESNLEKVTLSKEHTVNLAAPLTKITLNKLDSTEVAVCNLASESFDGKQTLIVFAKSIAGSASCYITEYL